MPNDTFNTAQYIYLRRTLWLIGGLLVFRIVWLFFSPLGLHGDEAQYWAWSKDLEWGYFTKPPLIAAIIAITTSIFGDSEWAIRVSSPALHSITGFMLFLIGRRLYDARTGFWAATIYLLMPALFVSSAIVSTDVSLLLCWSIALHALVRMRDGAGLSAAVQFGLAIGVGLLAKYAMLFFVPALVMTMLIDLPLRRALLSGKGVLAVLLTGLIIAPNIIWNLQNDFATLSHTVSNTNMEAGPHINIIELARFLGDQFGVFGPVTFVLLILALITTWRGKLSRDAKWLSLFVLAPLLIISTQALLSRANANWAVTAYIGAALLVAHYGVVKLGSIALWLRGGVAAQALLGFALSFIILSPSLTNAWGLANSVKRLRAWPETVTVLEGVFAAGHEGQGFTQIALDKRIIYYDLKYYGLENTAPLFMWMYHTHPENQAELTAPLPAQYGPVLLINYYENYLPELQADFARLEPLPPLDIDLGGGKRRKLKLWAGYAYTPTTTR